MEKLSSPAGSSPQAHKPLTTFVQTDATTFKDLVQRLTGPNEESSVQTSASAASASTKITGVRKPTFKLQERRQAPRKLTIMRPNSPSIPLIGLSSSSPMGFISPSSPGNYLFSPLISPPAHIPGIKSSDEKSPKELSLDLDDEEEENKAIKERGFYLHPSPPPRPRASRPMSSEPELLHLFPINSSSPKPVWP